MNNYTTINVKNRTAINVKNKDMKMNVTAKWVFTFLFVAAASMLHAGAYTNPVLPYDYSDPDVCQAGEDYYMTSSSFNCIPGLQILHSRDLVHWRFVDAALRWRVPGTEQAASDSPEYGCGVWAPSIRFHKGRFYIYYGDPDRGVYCVRSQVTSGAVEAFPLEWEEAVLVKPGKGFIDACPLWDEDGRVYLVHALAGSRAGLKSVLMVCELTADGLACKTESRIIFDGHPDHPTSEGPKFYKRNGYYYIMHPAGGVATGWQVCLRSRSPYGPYETKVVLAQGKTDVNGPHQGAWVGDWFLHFQDVGVAGRIVHLQPLRWQDDWPVMGNEGEPVSQGNVPDKAVSTIGENANPRLFREEFSTTDLPLSWQWSGNYDARYGFCNAAQSMLRLFSYPCDSIPASPSLLLQKIPANRAFTVTAKVRFTPLKKITGHERAGLIVAGRQSYMLDAPANGEWTWLRVTVSQNHDCQFYTSTDGKTYIAVGKPFRAVEGVWIGAKVGLYCTRDRVKINDSGYMDVDWFEIR